MLKKCTLILGDQTFEDRILDLKRQMMKYLEMKALGNEMLGDEYTKNTYLEINYEEIIYLRTNNPAIDINLITL